ncbi:allergen V5/Tpx-1-like protein [Nitzschia inconspicua]|nr:allergen V5/Tpx-1-like protein [Nitzschia inconspicua]
MQAVKLGEKCIATSSVTQPKSLSHKVCYSSLDPLTGVKFDGKCDACQTYIALPTNAPTPNPTAAPTNAPTPNPTAAPTNAPTASPTNKPTAAPTNKPTASPTNAPTPNPTAAPTNAPTASPTNKPTASPTNAPTPNPTAAPTNAPTPSPTNKPTAAPTNAPTPNPTAAPTNAPTPNPTNAPTRNPTNAPTPNPTNAPTRNPTNAPTPIPTNAPTFAPNSCACSDVNSPLAFTWKCGLDLYYCTSKITSICSQSYTADVTLVPLNDAQCTEMQAVKLGEKCIATSSVTQPKALSHKVCYTSFNPLTGFKFDGKCDACQDYIALPTPAPTPPPTKK